MAAVGFGLIAVGAMLIYAGMTGGSLVAAVQEVVTGKPTKSPAGGAPSPGTEAERDEAQTRRPAQP